MHIADPGAHQQQLLHSCHVMTEAAHRQVTDSKNECHTSAIVWSSLQMRVCSLWLLAVLQLMGASSLSLPIGLNGIRSCTCTFQSTRVLIDKQSATAFMAHWLTVVRISIAVLAGKYVHASYLRDKPVHIRSSLGKAKAAANLTLRLMHH